MIPHVIHQSWKTAKVPSEFVQYFESWRTHHPSWEFHLWTDEDNHDLVRTHYKWLLPTYESYPLGIPRADMARILYMHRYGGLYVDLDFECIEPFDQLMDQEIVFLGREKGGLGWYTRRLDYACNALMASPSDHPFWLRLLRSFVRSARAQRRFETRTSYVLSTTGPRILDREINEYLEDNDDLRVYPQNCFYPASAMEKSPDKRRKLAREQRSFAVHHFANSWFSSTMHLLMWLGYSVRRPFVR